LNQFGVGARALTRRGRKYFIAQQLKNEVSGKCEKQYKTRRDSARAHTRTHARVRLLFSVVADGAERRN